MREGWTYKKLGEVCDSFSGYTPSADLLKKEGAIPYFKVAEMNLPLNSKYLISTNAYIDNPAKVFPKGAIVFPKNGAAIATNKKRILGQDSVVDLNTAGLIVNDSILSCSFFYYNMLNIDFRLLTRGGAVPTLDMAELKKILIPTPSLYKQQSIVAELDKINELISLKKAQLSDLDSLAQSIFYDMFGDPIENEKGWELKRLGDLCEISSAKRVFIEEVVDSGVPFIRGTELTTLSKLARGEKMNYTLFITKEHYERLKAITGVPKVGDLLIPSINSEGIVWMVDTEEPLYFKDGRVLWVHVNKDEFASEALQKTMNILIKNIFSSMNGATFAELKLFVLRDLIVPKYPLPLQQEFAKRIELIEQQKAQISSTIKDLETLLASRMQYWFD